jgi:hypothetical protein
MEKVRQIATFCIGRAVMFASLAIFLIMFSFSFDPAWAFRAGAVLTLVMSAVLVFKAQWVMQQNPRRTEVWIYLDESLRPENNHARRYYALTLREVYGRFARASLVAACLMFAVSIGLSAIGYQPFQMGTMHAGLR